MKSIYELEGVYEEVAHIGAQWELNGSILVQKNGDLEGKVADSKPISQALHTIKGRLFVGHGAALLQFMKFANKEEPSNIFFALTKNYQNTFSGNYIGEWYKVLQATPYDEVDINTISFQKNYATEFGGVKLNLQVL